LASHNCDRVFSNSKIKIITKKKKKTKWAQLFPMLSEWKHSDSILAVLPFITFPNCPASEVKSNWILFGFHCWFSFFFMIRSINLMINLV
jgi:hypothetical protein